MKNLPSQCVILGTIVLSLIASANVNGREKQSSGPDMGSDALARLLRSARKELQTAKLSPEEIELRLKIVENAATVITSVIKAKPSVAKGKYIKGCYLSSTMGPGIPLDVSPIEAASKA